MLMPGYLPKNIVRTKGPNGLISLGYFDSCDNFHGEGIARKDLSFSNEPKHGYRIVSNKNTLEKLGDLDGRIALMTPGKRYFTLSARALVALLAHGTVKHGEIKESCAFGWLGGELYLLPWYNWDAENIGDGIYAQFYRSTQLGPGAIELDSLEVGATYKVEGLADDGLYLGIHKFVKLEKTILGDLQLTDVSDGPIFKFGEYFHRVPSDISFRRLPVAMQDVAAEVTLYRQMTEEREIADHKLIDIHEVCQTRIHQFDQARKEILPGYFTALSIMEDFNGGFQLFSHLVDTNGKTVFVAHDETDMTAQMASKMHKCSTDDLYKERFSREDLYSYLADNDYKLVAYTLKSGKVLRRLHHNGKDRAEERYVEEGLDHLQYIMSSMHPTFGAI